MYSENICSIRSIQKNDIEIIHNLALQIWPASFKHILSKEQIAYMMNMMYSVTALKKDLEDGVEFFVFNYQGKDIGYTAIQPKDEQSYKLHKIYLSHELHGKGLGKYQLQAMEQIIKNRGATTLYLNVNRSNDAINFYKRQGYQIIKTEDVYIGNGFFMNDYVMNKKIY